MEIKAKKASNEQKICLIEYMEAHIQFANDKFESVDGGHLRIKRWEELAAMLNSLGGAIKDASKWRKFWSDQKSHIKDKEVLRRAALEKSGVNGLGRIKEASDFERRVLQLMAPVVIAGDKNVCELLTVTQITEEQMIHQILEADNEEPSPSPQQPLISFPSTPPSAPSPPLVRSTLQPSQPSTVRTKTTNKRKSASQFSLEAIYLEMEQKKLKLMEEDNVLKKMKFELEQNIFKAKEKWKDREYELELRKLNIMERQLEIQNKNI